MTKHTTTNLLLESLPPDLLAMLTPHLQTQELRQGATIADVDETISHVYFPHSGMISFVVEMLNGSKVETAMLGRDGIVNAGAALDGGLSLGAAFVQVAGRASVMDAKRFEEIVLGSPGLLKLVLRHEQVLLAQTQQSSACHVNHGAEARLCRWLMRLRDITASNHLGLTQEFLAQMLGVQRASVSVIAGGLQQRDLIRYSRGHIEILDPARLNKEACECYGVVKAHAERLLPNAPHFEPIPDIRPAAPRGGDHLRGD